MRFVRALVFPVLLALTSLPVLADDLPPVEEVWGSLQVRSTAPIPEEVSNATQAQALAREAAVVRGQTALLMHILKKRTHSKKTLAEAEIPSLPLQERVRGYIKGARVTRTQWVKEGCRVTLVLDKSELRSILRRN